MGDPRHVPVVAGLGVRARYGRLALHLRSHPVLLRARRRIIKMHGGSRNLNEVSTSHRGNEAYRITIDTPTNGNDERPKPNFVGICYASKQITICVVVTAFIVLAAFVIKIKPLPLVTLY